MQDATTEHPEGPTSTAPSQISRLAFRAPPFWPNNVELWISQLEAAFGLAEISRDETKFQATVLDGRPMGDQKPSTVLAAMQHQAGRNLSDTALKMLWTRRLPQDIRAALAASSETSLSKLAEMADNIHEAILPTVSAVDQPSTGHSAEAHQQLMTQIQDLHTQIEALKSSMDTPHNRYPNARYPTHNKKGNAGTCWYHMKFGAQARKCLQPCNFKVQGNEYARHHLQERVKKILCLPRVSGNDWTVGNAVTYECNSGFTLDGDLSRVCQSSGRWDGSLPRCEPVHCSVPTSPQNGQVTLPPGEPSVGQRAVYSCDQGYRMLGLTNRVCLESGKWSPIVPTICLPVTCPPPPPPATNGKLETQGHYYGNEATYTCEPGYYLVGPETRRCGALGTWEPDDNTVCEPVRCPSPVQPAHGRFLLGDARAGVIEEVVRRFGSVLEVFCDDGYKLEGMAMRLCGVSGSWEGEEALCRAIKCPRPPAVENGKLVVDRAEGRLGDTAVYRCLPGYHLSASSMLICGEDETWGGPSVTCQPNKCPSLPGTTDFPVAVGTSVEITCSPGYVPDGTAKTFCGLDGKWDPPPPDCIKISCPKPPDPDYGFIMGDDFKSKANAIILIGTLRLSSLRLKKLVSGERFVSNEEVKRAVDEYFDSLPDSRFWEGILILEKRWTKCVKVKGDYVEK
ncbi:hypothetical protein LAZ67_14003472 [Cordylochernes scorpioides]|uniref:Sushi domain-containing protein n=1 Tax=Cordylochernes scorpioides TaxID=51811 RepID=A0ABY6L8S3_9ARAC|nr:hypothetical protein LAZ67_14003472 [Cordylochernes scorpioides]